MIIILVFSLVLFLTLEYTFNKPERRITQLCHIILGRDLEFAPLRDTVLNVIKITLKAIERTFAARS